jgi:hypothetical protein
MTTTDTVSVLGPPAAARENGLAARALGVIFSPYPTDADVATHPRVLGALALVLFVSVASAAACFSTARGRDIVLDQTVRSL